MKKQKLNTNPPTKSKSFKRILVITCLISLFTFSQCILLLPAEGGQGGQQGGGHESHPPQHEHHG